MATAKEVLVRLEGHEKECAVRYKNIEKQLADGQEKFSKLDKRLMALYPIILGLPFVEKFLQ